MSNEMHFRRLSNRSQEMAPRFGMWPALLFCEWNVLGRRIPRAQFFLGWDDVVGHTIDMGQWRVGDIGNDRQSISQRLDST